LPRPKLADDRNRRDSAPASPGFALDIHPSPDSTNINDRAFIFERERYTRSRLNALTDVSGYSDNAVRAVLAEHGQGGLREWLATYSQRARLEGRPVTG